MKKTILIVNNRQSTQTFAYFTNYIAELMHARQLEFTIQEPGCCATCKNLAITSSFGKAGTLQVSEFLTDVAEAGNPSVTICEKLTDVIDRLREESRYADLLIIDPATSFKSKVEDLPTSFVKEALTTAECPVLIAPEFFDGIEDIVFCFDGTASSVFAIKQFTYLFTEYNDKNAIILHINEPGKTMPAELNSKIHHWLKPHFSSINFHILAGNAKKELPGYLSGKRKLFVVMGAYGRGLLSGFFKGSASDGIIRSTDLPIFITHH